MGEKKKGLWNRLLSLDTDSTGPPPELASSWGGADRFDRRVAPMPASSRASTPASNKAWNQDDALHDEEYEEDDPAGVVITELPAGSPLASAGIRVGDLLTAVNGHATPDEGALARAFAGLRPGQPATLTLIRGGWEVTAVVEPPD